RDRNVTGVQTCALPISDLLILDEATSMLDPQGRRDVLEILGQIHKDKMTTIIYITHDLAEIGVSDHAVVMKDGSVINEGTVDERSEERRVGKECRTGGW